MWHFYALKLKHYKKLSIESRRLSIRVFANQYRIYLIYSGRECTRSEVWPRGRGRLYRRLGAQLYRRHQCRSVGQSIISKINLLDYSNFKKINISKFKFAVSHHRWLWLSIRGMTTELYWLTESWRVWPAWSPSWFTCFWPTRE